MSDRCWLPSVVYFCLLVMVIVDCLIIIASFLALRDFMATLSDFVRLTVGKYSCFGVV